ncbi:MAG: leucine-rich repeat domain-containing protein [Lachnospiraceae bacterium]|nr:leucine-rich repeat domain-containing protein [Lachnospiraceae bacterium]
MKKKITKATLLIIATLFIISTYACSKDKNDNIIDSTTEPVTNSTDEQETSDVIIDNVTKEGVPFEFRVNVESMELTVIGLLDRTITNLVIDESYELQDNDYTVTTIGKNAFSGYENLITVELPDTIETIGENAFSNCINLKSINLPDNLTAIPGNMFTWCYSLSEINIPQNIVSIGEYAFLNCYGINEITVPDTVESVGKGAFNKINHVIYKGDLDCIDWGMNSISYGSEEEQKKQGIFIDTSEDISYITDNMPFTFEINEENKTMKISSIEDKSIREISVKRKYIYNNVEYTVTEIGANAFCDCILLEKIVLPDTITSIGDYAFKNCRKLAYIKLPDTISTINIGTFANCSAMKEINFPEGLVSIGSGAFENCISLIEINIPDDVTEVGEGAFSLCKSLREVQLSDSMQEIKGYTFYNCNSLESIDFKEVSTISSYAFCECKNMKAIALPESITELKDNAFISTNIEVITMLCAPEIERLSDVIKGCSIGKLIIDNNIESIDKYMFYEMEIKEIVLPETVTYIGRKAFYNCSNLQTIIIPSGVTEIRDAAFGNCTALTSLTVPIGVEAVGKLSFENIQHIVYEGTLDTSEWGMLSIN